MTIVGECLFVLRLRQRADRKPKYFYMNGYDYSQLYAEMGYMQMHTITGLQRELPEAVPLHLTEIRVMGLEVVVFNLPQGYILCSETRLH